MLFRVQHSFIQLAFGYFFHLPLFNFFFYFSFLAPCSNLFLTSFSVEVFQNIVHIKKRQTNKCHHFHGLSFF